MDKNTRVNGFSVIQDLKLTGKHFGDRWRNIDIRQAFVTTGMEKPQHGAIV